MIPYTVRRIPSLQAKMYIREHHYSHTCSSTPKPCYGLFDNENLIGVLMFAVPCSENVRGSVFGIEHKDRVIELHRLHILDVTPKNTESWFITRCLQNLAQDFPIIKGVISFADSTEGHTGVVYRATNAWRCGTTSKAWFYIDQ